MNFAEIQIKIQNSIFEENEFESVDCDTASNLNIQASMC